MPRTMKYTRLAYILSFPSSAPLTVISPIIHFTQGKGGAITAPPGFENIGVHGLDPELYPLIEPLWYILHLPQSVADTLDVSCSVIRKVQEFPSTKFIGAVPHPLGRPLDGIVPPDTATLHFYPKHLEAELAKDSRAINNLVLAESFDYLTADNLPHIWKKIHEFCHGSEKQYCSAKRVLPRVDLSANLLPFVFMARQAGERGSEPADLPTTKDDALGELARYQAVVKATALLEEEKKAPLEAEKLIAAYVGEAEKNLDIPVSMMLPGLAPAYRKMLDKGGRTGSAAAAQAAEKDTLLFLTTHRALAERGAALVGREVNPEAFNLLRALEEHWAAKPKPQTIWRILGRIGTEVRKSFDPIDLFLMKHASSLSVFADFPLGLVSLDPRLAPLCCMTPIAYRPITPLTRALQFELQSLGITPLWGELRVLMVECIPKSDPVGKLSRIGWELALKNLEGPNVKVTRIEPTNVAEINSELKKIPYDVLIISAHGHYDRQRNTAGILIGENISLGTELGHVPDLVILSSCSVAPRGIGSVNITDLLLRQGAKAVLGTLVPVDVRRNATLMVRFLLYIRETMEGRFPESTLDRIWHHVFTSNAINDVVSSNPSLHEWAHQRVGKSSPIVDFMAEKSTGRIRKAFIYEDTVTVLREIAQAVGIEEKFDAWMAGGIIPESLFYVFVGSPNQIAVKDPFSGA